MPTARSNLLSLTLTPDNATLVECKRGDGTVRVIKRSELRFTDGVGLDQPEALGALLRDHLEQAGHSTKQVVVGLCSKWVLVRHISAPPADADAMRGIVSLQVERAFAGSVGDLSFDYTVGEADAGGQAGVTIAAVRRALLDQVKQVIDTAGLKLLAVTPTPLAAVGDAAGTVVLFDTGVAGVMRVRRGGVLGLGSFAFDPSSLGEAAQHQRLLADLARAMLQLPGGKGDDDGLTLILPASVSENDAQALTDAAAERFGKVETHQADPAELVAQHESRGHDGLINFIDSRLAVAPRKTMPPAMRWAVRAAVLALLVGGTLGYLWFDAVGRRDALQAEYDAIRERADQLTTIRADTRSAEGWFNERPPMLDAMLELTRTFPTEGEIRVETLSLRSDMTGEIACTAEDRETMDAYFAQMQRSPALTGVNRGPVRPVGGRSTWIDFPIKFTFEPKSSGVTP